MTHLTSKELEFIKSYLSEKLKPSFVWLFGSAARETMNSESDIDLAFMSDLQVDSYQIFMMAQELACSLGRDVDLINLKTASTVMKAQIVGKGKLLYEKDPFERKKFSARAFKEYALLNEERQIILERMTHPEDI